MTLLENSRLCLNFACCKGAGKRVALARGEETCNGHWVLFSKYLAWILLLVSYHSTNQWSCYLHINIKFTNPIVSATNIEMWKLLKSRETVSFFGLEKSTGVDWKYCNFPRHSGHMDQRDPQPSGCVVSFFPPGPTRVMPWLKQVPRSLLWGPCPAQAVWFWHVMSWTDASQDGHCGYLSNTIVLWQQHVLWKRVTRKECGWFSSWWVAWKVAPVGNAAFSGSTEDSSYK